MVKTIAQERISNNIAAIAINAGFLIAEGIITVCDSVALHNEIVRLAEDFEVKFTDEDIDGDYLGIIDAYSKQKLFKYYGVEA